MFQGGQYAPNSFRRASLPGGATCSETLRGGGGLLINSIKFPGSDKMGGQYLPEWQVFLRNLIVNFENFRTVLGGSAWSELSKW